MAPYLIDVNLPRYFSLWNDPAYSFVADIDDTMSDSAIWRYAQEQHLTIVTKDTDFADRILLTESPPHVIHIRYGNMKMRTFHSHLSQVWDQVCELSQRYRLVRVYVDRLEGIE